MILVDSGKAQIEGNGSHIIIELAMAINAVRDAFGTSGNEAIETALKMSESEVMGLFMKKEILS